ncbi:MoxR family ATPase [Micromonospora sp. CPCC 205371]|nr:MoxR family ATPase [Micromonospora sp. CPCC 205371]
MLDQFIPDLAERPGLADGVAGSYLPEDDVVDMVNVALLLRRPLLVTGKPGTGKSTLASSIAYELGLGPRLYWPITSRSRLADALYRYDAIGRLQQANLARAADSATYVPSIGEFLRLGPLGTALVGRHRPRVLLIDELDKSDLDLPNDLLNVLEEGNFEIPELTRQADTEECRVRTADHSGWAVVRQGLVRCNAYPIIVITSNGEREFPPAFLRRCVRVEIQPPSTAKLVRIVASRLGEQAQREAGDVIEQFSSMRDTMDLSTDQLLNAVYFATSGLHPDQEPRQTLVRRILRNLSPGAGSL